MTLYRGEFECKAVYLSSAEPAEPFKYVAVFDAMESFDIHFVWDERAIRLPVERADVFIVGQLYTFRVDKAGE